VRRAAFALRKRAHFEHARVTAGQMYTHVATRIAWESLQLSGRDERHTRDGPLASGVLIDSSEHSCNHMSGV